MTLDKTDAAEALAEIGQSQKRSASLYAYEASSPYLFLTGLMWLTADLLFQFSDWGRHWAWAVVSLTSVPIYFALGIARARKRTPSGPVDSHFWRSMAVWFLMFLLVGGTLVLFWPVSGLQIHSFIGLILGLAYMACGLWMGRRILIVGAGMFVLTVVGHYFVHEYYAAYMGVVGGGGMMLGALWLRRV